jgi:hypothetical protein
MIDAIKLLIVFVAIVVALNRRLELGGVLIAGAVALGFLYGFSPEQVAVNVWQAASATDTLRLVAIVICIWTLNEMLSAARLREPMVRSLLELFSDARVVLAIIPALIGLLPMPGGAMFSAPLVDEVGENAGLTNNQKAYVNYWFRHLWEYTVPLYPALILCATLLAVPVSTLTRHQWPLTLAAIVGGAIVVRARFPKNGRLMAPTSRRTSLLALGRSIWPVVLIILLTMFVEVDLLISLPLVILLLILVERPSRGQTLGALRKGLDWHIALVLFGAMIFKQILETSGAVEQISATLAASGIPALGMVSAIPFIVGFATGMTSAAYSIAVPVILPFLQRSGELYLPYTLAMYAGGLSGLMLSPVHLCLILTKDFFRADWRKIIAPTLFGQSIVMATALILSLVGF